MSVKVDAVAHIEGQHFIANTNFYATLNYEVKLLTCVCVKVERLVSRFGLDGHNKGVGNSIAETVALNWQVGTSCFQMQAFPPIWFSTIIPGMYDIPLSELEYFLCI